MKRVDFVRKVCPALTLAILNAQLFVSCSSEESDEMEVYEPPAAEDPDPVDPPEDPDSNNQDNNNDQNSGNSDSNSGGDGDNPDGGGGNDETNNETSATEAMLDRIDESGYLYEEDKLYINITNENFLLLQTPGEFINHMAQGVLLLRRNEDTLLAFDHCCPHQGATDLWSFDGNYFSCANHGNSFGIGEGNTAYCNSNSVYGNLKQFPVTVDGDLITVDFG